MIVPVIVILPFNVDGDGLGVALGLWELISSDGATTVEDLKKAIAKIKSKTTANRDINRSLCI